MSAAPAVSGSSTVERLSCFAQEDHVSLVLHQRDGAVSGWPLHLLAGWVLTPSPEANDEILTIEIGDVTLTVHGQRLAEITNALARCSTGLELTEIDPRYAALVDDRRPLITEVVLPSETP